MLASLPMPAEQMVRTFYSSLRNPTIAKLFRFANISENVGFGMGKLFSWKQLPGNEVTCESDRNVVRVTFYLRNNIDKVEAEATSNNHRLRELRVEYVNRARSPLLEGRTSCPMFVGLYKPLINFGG